MLTIIYSDTDDRKVFNSDGPAFLFAVTTAIKDDRPFKINQETCTGYHGKGEEVSKDYEIRFAVGGVYISMSHLIECIANAIWSDSQLTIVTGGYTVSINPNTFTFEGPNNA